MDGSPYALCMDVLMAIRSTLALPLPLSLLLGSNLFNMIIAMGVSQIARMSRNCPFCGYLGVKDQGI